MIKKLTNRGSKSPGEGGFKFKYGLYNSYDDHILAARMSYPYFIQHIVYPSNFHAGSHRWRIGDIYYEWAELLRKHQYLRVLAPRDFTKSFFFCEGYVCWCLWTHDEFHTTIISKTDQIAKDRLRWIRRIIIRTPELRYMAGLSKDGRRSRSSGVKWGEMEIHTTTGSKVAVAGFNSNIRGEHSHLIILDDPIDSQVIYSDEQNRRSKQRLLMEILPIAEPDTQVVITGTVQRDDDLYHSLPGDVYKLVTYRAIVDEEKKITLFPEKWSWEALMARKAAYLRDEGSERFFMKEYMNDATALQGEVFRESWMQYIHRDDFVAKYPERSGLSLYMGWDLAVGKDPEKGCATCGVVIAICSETNLIYVVDIVRSLRWNLPQRLMAMRRLAIRYPDILLCVIEDNAFQEDTVQGAIHTLQIPVKGITSTTNKMKRADALSVHFSNRRVVFLCEGWTSDGGPVLSESFRHARRELLSCPGSTWDFIDALYNAIKGASYSVGMADEDAMNDLERWIRSEASGPTADPLRMTSMRQVGVASPAKANVDVLDELSQELVEGPSWPDDESDKEPEASSFVREF